MPFTLSHAAVVVPLQRAGLTGGALVTSAWVFGTMSPDIFYFGKIIDPRIARMAAGAHELPGVLLAAPLAGGVAMAWWWLLVAPAARSSLPASISERLAPALSAPGLPRFWPAKVYGALAAGALTHGIWDGFTHHARMGTAPQWLLSAELAGYPAPRVLQAVSTLVGGAVVLWWAASAVGPWSFRLPGSVALTGATAAVGGVWLTQVAGSPALRTTAIQTVLTTGGLAAITTSVLALGWHAYHRVR